MIRLLTFSAIMSALLVSACGGGARAGRGTSAPPAGGGRPAPGDTRDSASARLVLALSNESSRYRVESRSAIFSAASDSAPIDSVVLSAITEVRATREATGVLTVRGSVDQLSISSGLGSNRQTQTLQRPVSLEWTFQGDSLRLVQPVTGGAAATRCDQTEETARDVLISILPPLPDTLESNETWRSSRVIVSCRGGLTLQLVTTSSFRAANLDSARRSRTLPLHSTGDMEVSGGGTQGATNIVLKGTGTSSSRYLFNLTNGVIQSGTAQSVLQLDFDLGYRTDRLIQRTTRTITRIQ